MRKFIWIVALIAALALVFAGCPGTGSGNDPDPGNEPGTDTGWEKGTVFDLDDFLTNTLKFEIGKTGKGAAFWGEDGNDFLMSAGSPTITVIDGGGGKRGLKFDTGGDDWGAGLDLKYGGFQFFAGDETHKDADVITIVGKVIKGASWMIDSNIGGESTAAGGLKWGMTGNTFAADITLTKAEVDRAKKTNPPALRINTKPETDGEIEIHILTVVGWRPVGKQFDPVENITGVPPTGVIDEEVSLTGATVDPAYATNKDIIWSIKDAGTTGVTAITDGKFTGTAAGTIIITATVKNGKSATEDYTKDFSIVIAGPPMAPVKVGSAAATETRVYASAGASVSAITGGYKTVITDYGKYAWFKVNLGAGKKLSDFMEVKFNFAAIEGDITYKTYYLLVSDTAFPADLNGVYDPLIVSGFRWWQGAGTKAVTCTIGEVETETENAPTYVVSNAEASTANEVYVCVYLHAGGTSGGKDTTFSVANIEFVAAPEGHNAVTGIVNVPATGTVNKEVNLTGVTVLPFYATNKTITWEIKDAGTTGVTAITNGKFTPTAAGTITVTATIENGETALTDYADDFEIVITLSSVAKQIALTNQGGYGITATLDANGYGFTVTAGTNHDWALLTYTINLGTATLKDVTKVAFDYTPISGDTSYKNFNLLAATSGGFPTSGQFTASNFSLGFIATGAADPGAAKIPLEIAVDYTKAAAIAGSTVDISIWAPMGESSFKIDNIKFWMPE